MAKKKAATVVWPGPRLSGKKIGFVGKFNEYALGRIRPRITEAGGVIVGVGEEDLDILVVGEGRGGKPPGEAARVQKRCPEVESLSLSELLKKLVPTREELLELIAATGLAAPSNRESTRWEYLNEVLGWGDATVDLAGADLRKQDFYGAHMERINLDGADLRGARLQYTHVGLLRNVNLDEIDGPNIYLPHAEDCTFRKANLEKAWMFWGPGNLLERCDFTRAKLLRARLRNGRATLRHCIFQGADLTGAELEGTTLEACDFREADLSGVLASRAQFERANLRGAKLARADLRNTSLIGADLRDADLTEAVLNEADLTGAKVKGANFTGAVLSGANLKDVDVRGAINLTPPVVRKAGPKLQELAAVVNAATTFTTSADVDLGDGQFAQLSIGKSKYGMSAASRHFRGEDEAFNRLSAPTFEQGMLNLADRWPGATLRLDTIQAQGGRLRGAKLQELAVAAWSETFGLEKSAEDLQREQEQQAEAARAETDELLTRMRKKGAKAWEAIHYRVRDRIKDLRTADLRGVNLDGIHLEVKDLSGAQFQGSSLVGASIHGNNFVEADFTGANLAGAFAYMADCRKACFVKANLQRADFQKVNLSEANLRGADLSDANLEDANLNGADLSDTILTNAKLKGAQYDPNTKLPARFTPPPDMIWNGPVRKVVATHAPGTLDFATFFANLGPKVEPERLHKVMQMLKKEKFQLFAEFSDQAVVGVVRSQSSDDLAYSCRLASDGAYSCGTQNLKPCGGLRGGLCKHLLVLIVGLTKSGDLDPATVDAWIDASRSRKAKMDKTQLSETFLRYQGAEQGTVDWRPTETVPEDYYAM